MSDRLERMIDQGAGNAPADIVLKGGRFFDLVSGELVESDIAICGDRIVGTCATYDGAREIDISGRIVVPGFIDTHLHIESSLVTPHEFDRCVLPYGVHHRDLRSARDRQCARRRGHPVLSRRRSETIMDISVQLSSCVPATASGNLRRRPGRR